MHTYLENTDLILQWVSMRTLLFWFLVFLERPTKSYKMMVQNYFNTKEILMWSRHFNFLMSIIDQPSIYIIKNKRDGNLSVYSTVSTLSRVKGILECLNPKFKKVKVFLSTVPLGPKASWWAFGGKLKIFLFVFCSVLCITDSFI